MTALAVACSSSATSTAISIVVVTTDYGVGSNRVAFGLVDRDGMPVRSPEAQVQAWYLPTDENEGEVRSSAIAQFQQWPAGEQGMFTTTLEFDTAGIWELQAETLAASGEAVIARGAIQVRPKTSTPSIGLPAPASVTPTGDKVDDLSTITSALQPDPDLYRLSVHEALSVGKPLALVFATPAFCVTATCGPQVEVVSQLKDQFTEQVNFIHVEVYENPHLMEGSRPAGGLVEAVRTHWRLPTEPWTFIMDEDGLVRAKFEGFTTLEELRESLRHVLRK